MISGGDEGIKGEGWWYGTWGGSQGPLAMNKAAERKQQVEDDTQEERRGALIAEARLSEIHGRGEEGGMRTWRECTRREKKEKNKENENGLYASSVWTPEKERATQEEVRIEPAMWGRSKTQAVKGGGLRVQTKPLKIKQKHRKVGEAQLKLEMGNRNNFPAQNGGKVIMIAPVSEFQKSSGSQNLFH